MCEITGNPDRLRGRAKNYRATVMEQADIADFGVAVGAKRS